MEALKSFIRGFGGGFKRFGHLISLIVNSVLLFFVYFIGVGITSIIAKIFGKRFLELDKNKESYWIIHEKKKKTLEEFKKMF